MVKSNFMNEVLLCQIVPSYILRNGTKFAGLACLFKRYEHLKCAGRFHPHTTFGLKRVKISLTPLGKELM